MRDLPLDREKALAAIAAGWGRTATAAHPLCRCAEPVEWPTSVPPCIRCGAGQGERCRQPGPLCGRSSPARYHRRVREHMAQFACPMHRP